VIASESTRAPEPFGKYLLDREIARGGMARVHLARLRGLGGFEKRLVVKQILPHLASDPRFVEMFVEEAKTLVQMSHPHIVPVYELGLVEGVYFLAMEYVEGATLADVLDDGALDEAEAAHAGAQICDALSYAHGRFSIVHRDVTPRNVMIDAGGHCRLLDFGIAAPASREGESDAGLFGTPGYLSPEQARGEAIAASSDLFSLGAVLWHALQGAPPEATRTIDGARAQRAGDARPALGPDTDRELAAIVERALDPDPGARFPDARSMGRALRGWLASRHPEGVAHELGARADRARARRERARTTEGPTTTDPGTAKIARTPTVPSRARVETLAQSRTLEELVAGTATGSPLEGPAPIAGTIEEEGAPAVRESAPGGGTLAIPGRSGRDEVAAPARASRPPRAFVTIAIAIASVIVGVASWRLGTDDIVAPVPPIGAAPREPADPEAETAAMAETEAVVEAVAAAEVTEAVTAAAAEPETAGTPALGSTEAPRAAQLAITTARGWATIEIDGRPLGTTPIRRAQLTPGAHTLVARNDVLGREARARIEVAPGARVHAVVDLDAARISVRER